MFGTKDYRNGSSLSFLFQPWTYFNIMFHIPGMEQAEALSFIFKMFIFYFFRFKTKQKMKHCLCNAKNYENYILFSALFQLLFFFQKQRFIFCCVTLPNLLKCFFVQYFSPMYIFATVATR